MQKLTKSHTMGNLIEVTISVFVLFVYLVSITVCQGFSGPSSVLFSVTFLINALCGAYLYVSLHRKRNFHFIELLGIGIGIGTISPAAINFTLKILQFPFSTTAYIFPLLVFIYFFNNKKSRQLTNVSVMSVADIDLILICLTPLIVLSSWSSDLFGILIYVVSCILIARMFQSFVSTRYFMFARILLLSSLPIGLMVANLEFYDSGVNPIWKSVLGVDVAFDESTSFSMANFGANGNALNLGMVTRGHILTHSWAGDFASLIDSPRFMLTGSVGFTVGVLGLSAIIFSISRNLFDNSVSARFTLIAMGAQASLPEEYFIFNTMRMAHAMSAMWLFLFCFILFEVVKRELRYEIALISLLITCVALAKIHWGIIGVLILTVIMTKEFWRSRNLQYAYILLSSLFLFVSFYYLFIALGYSVPVRFNFSFNYLLEIIGLFILRYIAFIGFFVFRSDKPEWLVGITSSIFAVIVHGILGGDLASDYWVSFSLLWSCIYIGGFAPRLVGYWARFRFSASTVGSIIIVFGLWISWHYFANNYYLILINAVTFESFLFVRFPEYIPLFAFTIVLFAISILTVVAKKFVNLQITFAHFTLLILFIATTLNFGIWLAQIQRTNIIQDKYGISLSSDYLFSSEQIEVANWIEENTDNRAIIGSGLFCFKPISIDQPFPQSRENDCLNRFMLTWITALAHRSVLVTPPVYSYSYVGSTEMIRDYNQSIFFGANPNIYSENYLSDRGVDFFVLDKLNIRELNPFYTKRIRFSNDDYLVIELIDPFVVNDMVF
jgi:hypothetical protein